MFPLPLPSHSIKPHRRNRDRRFGRHRTSGGTSSCGTEKDWKNQPPSAPASIAPVYDHRSHQGGMIDRKLCHLPPRGDAPCTNHFHGTRSAPPTFPEPPPGSRESRNRELSYGAALNDHRGGKILPSESTVSFPEGKTRAAFS